MHTPTLCRCLFILVISLTTGLASAHVPDETLNVPGEYPTIAAALEVAQEGDVVAVAPGVYEEHSLVLHRGVSLVGQGATPDDVVIDAHHSGRTLAMLESEALLTMVTLINGAPGMAGPNQQMGGNLLLHGGGPRVENVHIFDGEQILGGGVALRDCDGAELTDCVIKGNSSLSLGGGIYIANTIATSVRNTLLTENTAAMAGGAWYAARDILFMDNCTVVSNRAPQGAEGVSFGIDGGLGPQIRNTICVDNVPEDVPEVDIITEHVLLSDGAGQATNNCTLRNEPGWLGYLQHQIDNPGYDNLEADPLFCGDHPDFATIFGVGDTSPCLPQNNDCGELIGAYGQACLTTGVPETTPLMTQLHRAHPNPFNPKTTIDYAIARSGRVDLAIYNLAGRRVATLVSEVRDAGSHSVTWNGRDDSGRGAASGVYLCRLLADGTTSSVRLTLVK